MGIGFFRAEPHTRKFGDTIDYTGFANWEVPPEEYLVLLVHELT